MGRIPDMPDGMLESPVFHPLFDGWNCDSVSNTDEEPHAADAADVPTDLDRSANGLLENEE